VSDADANIFDEPFNRDRLRGFRLRADGDLADQLRGINQFNVTFSQGIEGLDSTENGNPLASRLNGRVDFTKVEFTYSRLQPLFWNLSTFVSAYAQWAFTPLLSPELCGYGGRFYGRAFDPSELVADRCLILLGELRLDMPLPPGLASLAQLYAFADYGRMSNLHPGFLTPNDMEGASVGGGIRFGWPNLNTDLYVAKAYCSDTCPAVTGSILPRDDTRVFFVVTARN
jgi:hemolysin activation/secretion protein